MGIVAIPSMGKGGLNDKMCPRFGRCTSFTFVELEKDEIIAVKTIPNPAAGAMGGAGVQATQIIGNNNADTVIVGFLGPNAAKGLKAINIKILQAPNKEMIVKEILDLYLEDKLEEITSANVAPHYGMGGDGRGIGRGGYGRGGFHNP
ncbi:MAG: NifB/NifX family molybdenum-iron cluster-binding protein [Candidatus Hodarchaeota archaeon]